MGLATGSRPLPRIYLDTRQACISTGLVHLALTSLPTTKRFQSSDATPAQQSLLDNTPAPQRCQSSMLSTGKQPTDDLDFPARCQHWSKLQLLFSLIGIPCHLITRNPVRLRFLVSCVPVGASAGICGKGTASRSRRGHQLRCSQLMDNTWCGKIPFTQLYRPALP